MVTLWLGLSVLVCAPAAESDAAVVEATPVAAPPKKVAVLEFKAEGLDVNVARNLNELFTSEAGSIPGHKVIGQSEIKDLLDFEVQKQTLGCVDEACFSQIGGALGVDLVVSGTVGRVGERFVINLKLIDIVKAETVARVGETIAGRVELLTDMIRIAAWQLLSGAVPAELQAAAAATRATLDAEAAKTAGDAAALAAAQQALAEAEKAKAEAEKAKAEVELAKARRAEAKAEEARRAYREQPAAPPAVTPPPPAPAAPASNWASVSRRVATLVAGLGLVGGGVMHGTSYYYASQKVGDARETADGFALYEGSQRDAQLAVTLRSWAIVGYGVGLGAAVAATVLRFFEPPAATGTARVVPTANGVLVRF